MEWVVVFFILIGVVVAGAFMVRLATSSRKPPHEDN